jgi:hypothetical protein
MSSFLFVQQHLCKNNSHLFHTMGPNTMLKPMPKSAVHSDAKHRLAPKVGAKSVTNNPPKAATRESPVSFLDSAFHTVEPRPFKQDESAAWSKPFSSEVAKPVIKKTPTSDTQLSPASFLRSLFNQESDNSVMKPATPAPKVFTKPSAEDMAAYDLEVVKTVRSKNLEKLRVLYQDGKSLNACNQFGESLLHMACRRGDLPIVTFLIREAKVRIDIRDDFGRNPFHDACWTPVPNHDVMDVLMEAAEPGMLVAEDVRGSTPFDYARRDHHAIWIEFLESRKKVLIQKIRKANGVGESPSPLILCA